MTIYKNRNCKRQFIKVAVTSFFIKNIIEMIEVDFIKIKYHGKHFITIENNRKHYTNIIN